MNNYVIIRSNGRVITDSIRASSHQDALESAYHRERARVAERRRSGTYSYMLIELGVPYIVSRTTDNDLPIKPDLHLRHKLVQLDEVPPVAPSVRASIVEYKDPFAS